MSTPATLPADFQGWDKAPATLPADFNKWDEQKAAPKEQPGFFAHAGSALAGRLGIDATPEEVSSAGTNLGNDLVGAAKGIPQTAQTVARGALGDVSAAMDIAKPTADVIGQDAERKAAGYSGAYRVLAPIASALGVNVLGMEQSAREGDRGGVIGHAAAVPAVMAATEGIVRGIGPIANAAKSVDFPPAVKAVGKLAAQDIASHVPIAGRLARRPSFWDYISAARTPNAPPPVYPGANLPATPPPEVLNPSLVSPSRTLPGMHSPEVVSPNIARPTAEPIPSRPGLALPPAKIAAPEVGDMLNDGLGGKPIQPSVSLKEQGLGVPKDFTPVKSTALKGYKYDAEAKEFHAMSKDGTVHIYGDVSPEEAQAFAANPSSGKAWQTIRNSSSPKVAKVVNGQRVANVPPKGLRTAAPDTPAPEPRIAKPNEDLTGVLTKSVEQAKNKKRAIAKAAQ